MRKNLIFRNGSNYKIHIMKDNLLIYIVLLIGILISGCESSDLKDIVAMENATKANDLVDFTLIISGEGTIEVSSPTIGTQRVQTTTTFEVQDGEVISLRVLDGDFVGWAEGIMETEYTYEAHHNSSLYAGFSAPVSAVVDGSGTLFINSSSVTKNSPYYANFVEGTMIHIGVDDNGYELMELTLNGSDIRDLVPGEFKVEKGGMVISAVFHVFTRYLVITESSSVLQDSYEIELNGYEANDEMNVTPFTYTGGSYASPAYVQQKGLSGFIRNTGYKTLYVHINFDGEYTDISIAPKDSKFLNLSSDNYFEDRLVNLDINVSYTRY